MTERRSRLSDDLAWFLDSLDMPPARLHEGYDHIADGDHLGGPAWSRRFEEWLTRAEWSTVPVLDEVVCDHRLKGAASVCPTCASFDESGKPIAETGRYAVTAWRYRWPMRAAMSRLARASVAPALPSLPVTLWQLAVAANGRTLSAALAEGASMLAQRWPAMGDPVTATRHIARALRSVRRTYKVTAEPPRIAKSDAQLDAEAAQDRAVAAGTRDRDEEAAA